MATLRIPLRGGAEVIELPLAEVPTPAALVETLLAAGAPLACWYDAALLYYRCVHAGACRRRAPLVARWSHRLTLFPSRPPLQRR